MTGSESVSRPVEMLEQGRCEVGLSQGELWFRYFELGGMSTALEVEAYPVSYTHLTLPTKRIV